jgi:hypothetical protein
MDFDRILNVVKLFEVLELLKIYWEIVRQIA